jgi:hypothetical protein
MTVNFFDLFANEYYKKKPHVTVALVDLKKFVERTFTCVVTNNFFTFTIKIVF